MKYTIDENLCKECGLDLPSVLAILLVKSNTDIPKLLTELVDKQVLVKEEGLFKDGYLVTQRWDDVLSNLLLDSEQQNPKKNEEHLEALAKSLMEAFPQGRKQNTNTYWRGNIKDTKLRLKKFFKLYGDKYTDEQIIQAAKRYVESFNGDYRFMRVLKYFIWKDDRKINSEGDGYIEEVSDLATLLENAGQEEINNGSWRDNVR